MYITIIIIICMPIVGRPLLIGKITVSVLHGVHNRFEIAVG